MREGWGCVMRMEKGLASQKLLFHITSGALSLITTGLYTWHDHVTRCLLLDASKYSEQRLHTTAQTNHSHLTRAKRLSVKRSPEGDRGLYQNERQRSLLLILHDNSLNFYQTHHVLCEQPCNFDATLHWGEIAHQLYTHIAQS